MSDHKTKQQAESQRATDYNELGPVDTLNDLAPETSVGPTRKATTQRRLHDADGSGYFESEAGSGGGLGAPLHLGPELKKDGGPRIGQYEDGYNTYAQPYRMALGAMGRVKDVSLTGAPMTPAELKQRPDLMARFQRLTHDGNWMRDVAYNQWSDHQTTLQLDIERLTASQHLLAGHVAAYRAVQAKLQQRQVQAELAADTARVAQIRETANTLANIVEVCVSGVGAIGGLGAALNAELGAGELVAGMANSADNHDGAEATGATDAGGTHTRSAGQRVTAAVHRVAIGVQKGGAIASATAKQLKKAGALNFTLQDLFIVLTGESDTYSKLQRDMVKMNNKLKALAFNEEAQELVSVNDNLKGFAIELAVQRSHVQANRSLARRGAKTFAKSLGKGNEGIAAMYAAEAWQELAKFGEHADRARQSLVDPHWKAIHDYLFSYDPRRYAALGAYGDARELAANLKDVKEQRGHFNKHLPEWQLRAKQWNDFLAAQTGAPLVVNANEGSNAE